MRTNILTHFIILFFAISLHATETVVDSLANPTMWLRQQNAIGQELLEENQEFDKAVSIFKSAHLFSLSKNLSHEFTEISIGYGIALYKNGDIQNSYAVLLEVLPKIDNSSLKLKAEVSQILGMTLVFKNKFPEGYKYQMEALKYYSDIGDSIGMMEIYYDLGSNFGAQNQPELALKNYEKGITIAKSLDDTKMKVLGITALGNTWATMGELEKALKYNDESMELIKILKDEEELAWTSINRGHILGQLKRYEESEFYLKQAYDLSFKLGNKLLTAYSLEQMSDLNLKQGQLKIALEKLDESYEIFQELGQTNSVKEATRKYAEIYYQQKNFSKYKEYTDKYISLKDSLYSTEMMDAMASLKQDFEIHKIERENKIALLTKDQEVAMAENQATFAITMGAIISIILLLILMYIKNKATKEKNAILIAKNSEILRQNEFLANSNRDLEKFAYIISHDLKEPLRNINGFTKLLTRRIKKYTSDEDITDYAEFITNGTQQMAELLNGLLEYSKINTNKSEKEVVDLNMILNHVVNNQKIQLQEKKCEIQFDNLPSVACRATQLSQVFQNLIANAVKFSKEDGNKISIGVKDIGDEYEFFIKDEGIGINAEYQKDIFVVFKRLHHRGTYSGSGIGLATCQKIVEDHGGRIWVESEEGVGSWFFFTLPKTPTSEDTIQVNSNIEKTNPVLEEV